MPAASIHLRLTICTALSLSVRNGTIPLALAPLLGEVAVALPVVVYAALQTCTSALLVLALRR